MIDIIIPAYNSHETIKKSLYSICYQTISNKIKVYLINDKSDYSYKEIVVFFKKYINIREIDLDENVGPGLAREIGIQKSKSKYIMFMDSDDVFASPTAVKDIYDEINNNKLDLCIGRFVECKESYFIQHNYDDIWLHGKIYRRSFLEKNNIHFNNTRVNEDNYFNQCILLSNPKMKYIDLPIYFWMYNPKSITRINNSEYKYKSIIDYIDNMNNALLFGVNNNKNKNLIANKVVSVMYAIYYYYIEYQDNNFLVHSKNIKMIFMKYKDYCINIDNIKNNQYEYAINSLTKTKILESNLSFIDFLKEIGE